MSVDSEKPVRVTLGDSPVFRCWYVDPSRAEGFAAFAAPSFGPSPISAPFLAACGAAYGWLLAEYDINYYLFNKPAEWKLALALGGPQERIAAWVL